MRCTAIALLAAALGVLAACGEDRRTGGGGRRPGTFEDAQPNNPPDTGSMNTPDGGTTTFDSGMTGPLDATSPAPDSGTMMTPDSGFAEDAMVMPESLRIAELQDEGQPRHPAPETVVRISNVIVSAVYTAGQNLGSFWIQEPAGGPFSGIFVYVEMPLIGMWTVNPGDRLTLVGRYTEYFELSEIVLMTIESQGPGLPPLPEDRSAFEVSDNGILAEAYEGVLIRVSELQVTSSNPDAPMDFGEFEVTGGLRIDDSLYRVEPRPLPGTTIDYVSGVMTFAFEHRKLLPRDFSDVGPMH